MIFLKNCSKDDNHKTTQKDLIGNICFRGIFVWCQSFISSIHDEYFFAFVSARNQKYLHLPLYLKNYRVCAFAFKYFEKYLTPSLVGLCRIMVRMYRCCNVPVTMYPSPGRNVPLPRQVSPTLLSGDCCKHGQAFTPGWLYSNRPCQLADGCGA